MAGHNGQRSLFDRIVLAAILVNLAIVAWSYVDHSHDELLERADVAILWFFAGELAIRLWMDRLEFFRNAWNCVDAVIIVVALLPVAGASIAILRAARLARSFHLMRHSSHLRVFRWFVAWNNKSRHMLEARIEDGRLHAYCFYCGHRVKLWQARVNRRGWLYGPCCGDRWTHEIAGAR